MAVTVSRGLGVVLFVLALVASSVATPAEADQYYRTRWALLIGIGRYGNRAIPALRYCDNDVAAIREVLTSSYGFPADHVVALVDQQATREGIIKELSRLADSHQVRPDDSVLVYFSGHGQTVPLPRGGEMGFLVPYDASVDLADPANPAPYYASCISMDELRRHSALVSAKHILFLVDACYSGLAAEASRDISSNRALETVAGRPVRQLIVAGLKDEKVVESPEWRHGAFTEALLTCLNTYVGDFNQDGVITGLELATYLRGAVPELAPQTPQYVSFSGDGEYLLTRQRDGRPSARADAGPSISLIDPPDSAGGGDVIVVRPVGDTVTLRGLVTGDEPVSSLVVDGRSVLLTETDASGSSALRRPTDTHVFAFSAQLAVGWGERKEVVIVARDARSRTASRRFRLQAEAADTTSPRIRLTGLRLVGPDGADVDWRGLSVASKGLTTASKALTTASKAMIAMPREGDTVVLEGFADDERGVVSLDVMDRPAQTRRATAAELAGLGWTSGIAFEGVVPSVVAGETEVLVTALDAAGNQASEKLLIQAASRTGPEVVIIEPPQTRGIRGTGLLIPKGTDSVRIAGLARAGSPIVTIAVGDRQAVSRPATTDELHGVGWQRPATHFGIEIPVAATGRTEGITVEVVEKEGGRTAVLVLVQRPGPALDVQFSSERPTYRIGERVHLIIASDRDAYVYIFHREPDGSLSVFLPNVVEPDCFLAGGGARMFPNPAEEARWEGQYGAIAQEPAGTDTAYCLALPRPLPTSALQGVSSIKGLAALLGAEARAAPVSPAAGSDEQAITQTAPILGGCWRAVRYQVAGRR